MNCPYHPNRAMVPDEYAARKTPGALRCTAKVGLGMPNANERGYCIGKWKPGDSSPSAPVPAALTEGDVSQELRLRAAAAALDFARVVAPEDADSALALAARTFHGFLMPCIQGLPEND